MSKTKSQPAKSRKRQARFSVKERVLCYEPDLSKARVVYDAKILKVECPDMSKKKKAKEFHYLVHFQGWSTTWDRKVTEEFLLKVTSENRQLQKKLFSEADKKQSKSGGSRSESRSQSKSRRKRKLSPSEAGDSNNSLSVSIDNESISSGSGACGGPPSGASGGPSGVSSGHSGAKAAKVQPSPSISGSIISNCNSELDTEGSFSAASSSKEFIIATEPRASVSPSVLVKSHRQNRLNSADMQLSEVENQAPIKMTDELKHVLEQDYYKVCRKKVLTDLPAPINVASVLEDYVRNYAASALVNYEKQISKSYYTVNRKETSRDLLSKVLESIDIAKEIADGLRVIFDFNLLGILLYGSHGEVKQYNEVMKPGKVQKQRTLITKPNLSIPTKIMMPPASVRNRRQSSTTIDHTLQGTSLSHSELNVNGPEIVIHSNSNKGPSYLRKSSKLSRSGYRFSQDYTQQNTSGTISSQSSTTSSQSTTQGSNLTSLNPPAASPTTPQAIQVLRDLHEWRLVPDSLYEDTTKKPLESLVYGPIHLLRLFVKLPEIIGLMNTMPVKKKKLVLKYMDSVLEYLHSHQDFFP